MTVRLESPLVAVVTGPADCTNVASETEFAVRGDPNMPLEALDTRLGEVYLNLGDRWEAIDDAPRKGGVRLEIMGTAERIPESGFPSIVMMQATESSTLTSTFSNEGGSLRFADLVAQTRPISSASRSTSRARSNGLAARSSRKATIDVDQPRPRSRMLVAGRLTCLAG